MLFRKTITLLALAGLILLAGCFHRRKPPVPTAQQQAPTITQPAPPQPAPAPTTSTTTETKPKPAPTSSTTSSSTTPNTNATKSKPHAGRPRPSTTTARKAPPKSSEPTQQASAKPSPQIPGSQQPTPVAPLAPAQQQPVPGAAQIVPGLPHDEAMHSRFTTEQLLLSTDQNLAGLKRTLSPGEQDMVAQIRLFMQQSRAAIADGDMVRARNLAMKAHLLSDDLVQR